MKMHIVLEPQKEGGFVAYVPELPGRYTQEETRKETLDSIKKAADLYSQTHKEKQMVQ